MGRISLYTFLILAFLGLSKSFSPSEKKTHFIKNEKTLSHFFQGAPLSLILIKYFRAGFLIKTYYLQFKIIHGFKGPETITVRTSKKFYQKNAGNLGMSLFRRDEFNQKESTLPMPPGSLYIGNRNFGRWHSRSSKKDVWVFHNAYQQFPSLFFWGTFKPNRKFYKALKSYTENQTPFYGTKKEFGTQGSITKNQKLSPTAFFNRSLKKRITFKEYIKRIVHLPPWESKEVNDERTF